MNILERLWITHRLRMRFYAWDAATLRRHQAARIDRVYGDVRPIGNPGGSFYLSQNGRIVTAGLKGAVFARVVDALPEVDNRFSTSTQLAQRFR